MNDAMPNAVSTGATTPQPISVAVTSMPDSSKSLFKDPTRLMSLAAFLFSVITGVFATYQTWRSSRESTIDSVGKLIEQYYAGQEKLAKLDTTTQIGYANLLRSQLRGAASRTVPQALRVQDDIDDGTWLALAQINDAENNFDIAEMAWRAAAKNTRQPYVYTFAMRGLFANLLRQNKLEQAQAAIKTALDAAVADKIAGTSIVNNLPSHVRLIEKAASHVFLVSLMPDADCSIVASNYDAAISSLSDASGVRVPFDLSFQIQVLYVRSLLNVLKAARAKCPPASSALLQQDFCSLLTNLMDNSLNGFTVHKGAPEDKGFRPRIPLPDTEYCSIDQNGVFNCKYPEADEASSKERFETLGGILATCSSLQISPPAPRRESPTRWVETTTARLPNGTSVNVERSFWKPTEKGPQGSWNLSLEIRMQ